MAFEKNNDHHKVGALQSKAAIKLLFAACFRAVNPAANETDFKDVKITK